MTLTALSPALVFAAGILTPHLTELAKSRFGSRAQRVEEGNRSYDQLQEDLAGERAERQKMAAELATTRISEDGYREQVRLLVKENINLVKQVADLEIDLKAILKGGLTK